MILSIFLCIVVYVSYFTIQRRIHMDQSLSDTLQKDTTIRINDTEVSVHTLASRYQPKLTHHPEEQHPATHTYYTVRTRPETYVITYWIVFPDEEHPIPLVNELYRIHRQLRYGSRTDIEPVRIQVEKNLGEITRVTFETAEGTYQNPTKNHILTRIKQQELEKTNQLQEKHVLLNVITWNHMFAVEPPSSHSTDPITPKLSPLSQNQFSELTIPLRSSLVES